MSQGRADRLAEEDGRRFEELFLPHLDATYNLGRWIFRRDQDARDVVQDAYIRAFKGFLGFRGGNGRAWFLTIVRNATYDWLDRHAPELGCHTGPKAPGAYTTRSKSVLKKSPTLDFG
jgi:RNA polymerase sigma factor (sigma-70 family)